MKINNAHKLIGKWLLDPGDTEAKKTFGDIALDFSDSGLLTYVIHKEEKEEIIYLSYKVVDNQLITNQSKSPREEITNYEITKNGELILEQQGRKSKYIRRIE